MSILKLKINGRSYDIICNKNQHDDLNQAAINLNERIDKTLLSMPKASHDMALIITALMMQDELIAKGENSKLDPNISNMDYDIDEIFRTLEFYTKQLENLALEQD